MLAGPASMLARCSRGSWYPTSSGPKHSAQACEAPSSAVAPHSRQKRWLAKPKRDGVVTDVVTMRGLSPSSVPAADQPRAGLGTCHGAGLARRHRGGCRGFTGPYPSTPLDERYEVVSNTVTDVGEASPPQVLCLNLTSMSGEPGGRVLIASNRGPVSFSLGDDGKLTSRRGGGGLVSGLSAIAGRAEMLWVCAALSDADRAAARAAPGGYLDVLPTLDGAEPGAPASAVQMLDIPAAIYDRAYNSIANSTLWFIHHLLYDTPNRPVFGLAFRREWESYRAYNAAFADALAAGAGDDDARGTRAMVQDYHLSLAPRMLAERRPDLAIAHFSHTPWAPPDYYALLPDDVAAELLDGILGADHAGFHAQRWADAFLDCCEAVLGAQVDRMARTVRHADHTTTVGVHPLGVDPAELRARAAADDVQAHVSALTTVAGGRKLIVRIDRTELSKNIVRGLAAYRELLITEPRWRGRVTHLAFAYPSRHDLPEYREYTASVQRMAREIVDEFGTEDWTPLV